MLELVFVYVRLFFVNLDLALALFHRQRLIALRDLAAYIDEKALPADPLAIMERRKKSAALVSPPSSSPAVKP